MSLRNVHLRSEWLLRVSGACEGRRSGFFRRRGVTLLEILLSMGLLVILSAMTYWFYSSSVASRAKGLAEAEKLRLARVILDRIATEIRQASTFDVEGRVGITGDREQIWLLSARVPTKSMAKVRAHDESPAGEYDLVKVEYRIARHPDVLNPEGGYPDSLGLARVEISSPKPYDPSQPRTPTPEDKKSEKEADGGQDQSGQGKEDSGEGNSNEGPTPDEAAEELLDALMEDAAAMEGEDDGSLGTEIRWEELYSPEIKYLRFCYFDGKKWWDRWEVAGENPLPQLVQVTIGFESHAPLDAQFGQELGRDEWNEEFCECMNREPQDCEPLPVDQFSTMVRVAPADPLFRSRVTREGQSVLEQLNKATKDMRQ